VKKHLKFLISSYIILWVFLWFAQDVILFPQLKYGIFSKNKTINPPDWIDSFYVQTKDGDQLNVWTTFGKSKTLDSGYVAVIFHGNGETVEQKNFLPFFARHRVPAFTFDYRGYGNSTGWPTEQKILSDAETVYSEIVKRTNVTPQKTIILGNSIGTGPAGYLASKINPHTLIFIAGYSSLSEIVKDNPVYRWFPGVLKFNFPNSEYLKSLNSNCAILAHGKQDNLIKFRHLDLLNSTVKNANVNQVILLPSDNAEHNDIYYSVESELDRSLDKCMKIL
jgi:hypothetical protein